MMLLDGTSDVKGTVIVCEGISLIFLPDEAEETVIELGTIETMLEILVESC